MSEYRDEGEKIIVHVDVTTLDNLDARKIKKLERILSVMRENEASGTVDLREKLEETTPPSNSPEAESKIIESVGDKLRQRQHSFDRHFANEGELQQSAQETGETATQQTTIVRSAFSQAWDVVKGTKIRVFAVIVKNWLGYGP